MNIAIIGPRGVGKSKVSRKLSKLTGIPVISTDMIAIYESGMISIKEIVARDNGEWKNFRKLELDIIKKLSIAKNLIIDCGGGILFDVNEKNQEFFSEEKYNLLKSFSVIIGLTRDTDYLLKKVSDDSNRPNLGQINSYKEILERRLPYYKKASDYFINIEDMEIGDVSTNIIKLLGI